MSAPDRIGYGARQQQLLDALLRGDGYPEGFVAAQADAAGQSLRRKRARAVASAWPALALDLGRAFAGRFDAYVREEDAPAPGDPLADGVAFARRLARDGGLGDDARVEVLLARAALAGHGRGVFLRAAWLRRPYARLLVVVRLPCVGVACWRLRPLRGAGARERRLRWRGVRRSWRLCSAMSSKGATTATVPCHAHPHAPPARAPARHAPP